MAKKLIEKAAVTGKAELALILGWARTRLDRRIESDPDFPVKRRGTRAGGWEFDAAAVVAYLDGAPVVQVPEPAAKPAKGDRAHRGPDVPGVSHRGEATASQRLKNAQAAREEDKLRLARSELVEAEEMRLVLGTMLAHLGKGIDGLPDMIVRRLSLPDESAIVLREMADDLRRQMVLDLKPLLAAYEDGEKLSRDCSPSADGVPQRAQAVGQAPSRAG